MGLRLAWTAADYCRLSRPAIIPPNEQTEFHTKLASIVFKNGWYSASETGRGYRLNRAEA